MRAVSHVVTYLLQLPGMTRAAFIHILTEIGPVLTFFFVAQIYSFETAAFVFALTTAIMLVVSYVYERFIPTLPLVTGAFIIVSGLLTFYFHDPDILIFSDTLYYLIGAGALGYGLYKEKYYLKTLFQRTFAMHDEGWEILTYRWLIAFTIFGIANEIVRITASPEFWVKYRVVKIALIAVFAFYQFTLSGAYRIEDESNKWGLRTKPMKEGVIATRKRVKQPEKT